MPQDGSATSSQMDLFPVVMSINATSATSALLTSTATRNATSLPESDYGPAPCAWPDGPTSARYGRDRAHASLSPRQAREKGLLTSGTFGPTGSGSSNSAVLMSSLANRLRAATASCGSTLYQLTWKRAVTPSGRSIFRLRAWGLPTSGKGCGGSPTPTAPDGGQSIPNDLQANGLTLAGRKVQIGLNAFCKQQMAGSPTPAAVDARSNSEALASKQTRGSGGINLNTAARTSGWPTPRPEDAESSGFSAKRMDAGKTPDNLHAATKLLLTGWATPNSRDYRTPAHKTYAERGGGNKGENLNHQVAHVISGATLNGSTAPTAKGGLLNPEFSRWLQGIPATWPSCATTATRSTRSSARK
jgi:hypothetical protein